MMVIGMSMMVTMMMMVMEKDDEGDGNDVYGGL